MGYVSGCKLSPFQFLEGASDHIHEKGSKLKLGNPRVMPQVRFIWLNSLTHGSTRKEFSRRCTGFSRLYSAAFNSHREIRASHKNPFHQTVLEIFRHRIPDAESYLRSPHRGSREVLQGGRRRARASLQVTRAEGSLRSRLCRLYRRCQSRSTNCTCARMHVFLTSSQCPSEFARVHVISKYGTKPVALHV